MTPRIILYRCAVPEIRGFACPLTLYGCRILYCEINIRLVCSGGL